MALRRWGLVLSAATVLALIALASNATTMSQVEAEANTLLAVRTTISMLVNAGTLWAALAVVSGWLVRRPAQALAAGCVSLLVALVVHYGVGLMLGMFEPNVWTENQYWFEAVIVGGPLGLVGAIARRRDLWGTAARLVVPGGAVLEPFVIGLFASPAMMPWATRLASAITGGVLVTLGSVGCIAVFLVARNQRASA